MEPHASSSLTRFTQRTLKQTTRPLMTAELLFMEEHTVYAKIITTFVVVVVVSNVSIMLFFISSFLVHIQGYRPIYHAAH